MPIIGSTKQTLRLIVFLTSSALALCGEIPQPVMKTSSNRVLTDTLTLKMSSVVLPGRTIMASTYNGVVPGSTWRVSPGDTIRVRLNNQLPPNTDQDSADQGNFPQRANTTNLHVHGLNVSPKGNSDNVLLSILPGESIDYVFALPKYHASGTYWYHPHHHTSTWAQVSSSLAGSIIVDDDPDSTVTDPRLLRCESKVFVFSMIRYDTVTNSVGVPVRLRKSTMFSPLTGMDSPVLVNGVMDGTVTMRPGEIQRWRLINGTFEPLVKLRWLKINGTDTTVVPQHEIAADGLYFDAMRTVDTVIVHTGARSDVLVTAPATTGTYVVELTALGTKFEVLGRRIAFELTIDGEPLNPPMELPTRLPKAMQRGTINDDEIVGSREVVFDIDPTGTDTDSTAVSRMFKVNNAPFNHDVVNITVRAGTAEEWTIRNISNGTHPFHIHVNEFQVTEIGGVKQDPPVWRDVLLLMPKTTYKIRHRFDAEFDGKTVLHCHYLPHEDWGMMNIIEILPATSPVHERPWDEPLAFPNPAIGRFSTIHIRVPELIQNKGLTATLYDLSGNVLVEQRLEPGTVNASFDMHASPAGTYYVRLSDGASFNNTDMIVLIR
ncbi:MAG: T9SS type A sorting domain-containing protein [Candidatus Kapabacteria bacterium]|nr:T9SS type A sorting domain-containing protein [Candidatus Kapabacteria bacterium]